MVEEKVGCLQPLMELSNNYLELLLKLPGPEFKETREKLEKIYTRGQNLIYDAKDYKAMTKAFVSSAYELVMVYRDATSPKPKKTESESVEWLNYGPAQIAYTSLENMASNNEIMNDSLTDNYGKQFDTEYKLDMNQFAQNLFNTKPAGKEINPKLNYLDKDIFNHYKDRLNNIKKVEV